jgi:hypothetical protein
MKALDFLKEKRSSFSQPVKKYTTKELFQEFDNPAINNNSSEVEEFLIKCISFGIVKTPTNKDAGFRALLRIAVLKNESDFKNHIFNVMMIYTNDVIKNAIIYIESVFGKSSKNKVLSFVYETIKKYYIPKINDVIEKPMQSHELSDNYFFNDNFKNW